MLHYFENDSLKNFSSKSWNQHIDVNLKAPAYLTKGIFKKTLRVKITIL